MKNRYHLDVEYFKAKLKLVLRDINNYRPDELARELLRLSLTSENVLNEPEFQKEIK